MTTKETPTAIHFEDHLGDKGLKSNSTSDDGEVAPETRRKSYFDINRIPTVDGPVISEDDVSGKAMCPMLMYSLVVVGASSFLFGYDNAIISPIVALVPFVQRFQGLNPTTGTYVFTADKQSLLFSLPLVGSVIGACTAPVLQARFGRKWPLAGSYIFALGGIFLQTFAPSLGAFVVGRFWTNIASGIGAATAPLYLSEIAPSSIRGAAVASANILSLMSSVLAACVVLGSKNFSGDQAHLAYQLPLGIQAIPPGALIPLTIFLPDSPQWLAARNQMEKARKNLRKIRGFSDCQVDDELRVMKMTEDNQKALAAGTKFWHLFSKEHFERTISAGSMYSFNQLSGIILTTTYATVFIEQLNVGDPYVFTVIAQVSVLVGTLIGPLTLDRAGRRPTALLGMSWLLIIDIICGVLAFYAGPDNKSAGLALISFSMIFNCAWAASFYSISNLLPAEIASVKMRNYTMAYTIAWAQTTAVITTFVVPQITSADGANLGAKAYLIFAGCMVLIIIFTYFLVPETKGRTFAEIDELYDRKVPKRQWKNAVTNTEARHSTVVTAAEFRRRSVRPSVSFPVGEKVV